MEEERTRQNEGGFRIDWKGFRQSGIHLLQKPLKKLFHNLLEHPNRDKKDEGQENLRDDPSAVSPSLSSSPLYKTKNTKYPIIETDDDAEEDNHHHIRHTKYNKYNALTNDQEEEDDEDDHAKMTTNRGNAHKHNTYTSNNSPPTYQQQLYENDIHVMVFDESTQVGIVSSSSDCICKFWNSLEYQF